MIANPSIRIVPEEPEARLARRLRSVSWFWRMHDEAEAEGRTNDARAYEDRAIYYEGLVHEGGPFRGERTWAGL